MAKVYFLGTVPAVAQESRATPAVVETGDIFNLLVNGYIVATFTATAATVANVTLGLTNAWNASTHPYAAGVAASDRTTYVKLLAISPGMPFTVTATTVNGGVLDLQTLTMSTPVANAGPNVLVAANCSGGALPANGDDFYIEDTATSILWGLDALAAVTLASLTIADTFTGKIGLDWAKVSTNADGSTSGAGTEYRGQYFQVGCSGVVDIGKPKGLSAAVGSGRILLDFVSTAPTVIIHRTADTEAETGRCCVRTKFNSASAVLIVRQAYGGVGVATEKPSETSTIGSIRVLDSNLSTRVVCGHGVTLTNWDQKNGTNRLECAATLASLKARGGELTTNGDFTVTTLENDGATMYLDHIKTGGDFVTLARLKSGRIDTTRNGRSVSFGEIQQTDGSTYAPGVSTTAAAMTKSPAEVEA